MFNPLNAVQIVGRLTGSDANLDALGSCFAFREKTCLLTARHCVGNLAPGEIGILGKGKNSLLVRPAAEVHRHPKADVAAIRVAVHPDDESEPFWDCVGNYGLGEDFIAYGYPEDIFGEQARTPVPRLFKGHFQRFLWYESRLGYEYVAGEMSIGCPAGLSGGPLSRPGAPVMLTGIVAENLESTTLLHTEEAVEVDGSVTRVRNQAVISYGICVMLDQIKDWLDSIVEPGTHR